jgi:hypothetical protein
MLTPLIVALALFPALSTAVPVADLFDPSPSVMGTVQLAMPETASEQANVIVTVVEYHPFVPFGDAGAVDAVMTGAVLSILIVTDAVALSAAPFVAVHVRVVSVVFDVSVVAPHPVLKAIPVSASDICHVTVTSDTYQPLVPAVPATCEVTTGAVVSSCSTTTNGDSDVTLPQTTFAVVSSDVVTSRHAPASECKSFTPPWLTKLIPL